MTAATSPSQSSPPAPSLPEPPNWLCISILAALTLAIFSGVLFLHPREVLSNGRMDLRHFFVDWRRFGFDQLKSGHIPLWNPHYDSGVPFVGNFQSALFYPLNFLYLILPLEPAINWTIALHVFLGGVFMFYWTRHRALHSLACLLASVMFMFCGPHFLHIQAGHLPNLCTLIWAPLLFLAIDKLIERPSLPPCLLGMFAAAMAVFAGHPQFVFYMVVAAGIYSALNLIRANNRLKIVAGMAAIVLGGIALSAVQLFTGLREAGESVRNFGMPFNFAATYSFPPENFLTLLAPNFFGDAVNNPYWGRWMLQEASLFVSVTGLVMALYGAATGRPATRRFAVTMLVITLLLALGGYTPLFHLLYSVVPGFDKFRGMEKFLWLSAIFLSLLAAIGFDQLLKTPSLPRPLAFSERSKKNGGRSGDQASPSPPHTCGGEGTGRGGSFLSQVHGEGFDCSHQAGDYISLTALAAVAGIALLALSFLPRNSGAWAGLLAAIQSTGSTMLPDRLYSDPHFILQTGTQASESLMRAAVCLLALAAIFYLAKSRRNLACVAVLLLAVAELAAFASASIMTFRIVSSYSPRVLQFLAQHPGDYRIKHFNPNSALSAGTFDISGEDPAPLLRYTQFLDFADGANLNTNALRLIRCRYIFSDDEQSITEIPNPLARLLLVNQFTVKTNSNDILNTLGGANFPIEDKIILESQPNPAPQPSVEKGRVTLLDSTTDTLDIQADVPAPTLLLITDAFSEGWRALPMPGSSQARYRIMHADYALRAIPLAAGHHLIRMEYAPRAFRIGWVVSLIAWIVFLPLAIRAIIVSR